MTVPYRLPNQHRIMLGSIYITPAAGRTLASEAVSEALSRHAEGDWGDVCAEDWAENELSLKEGFRLFSVYHDGKGVKFWVITEADRGMTTVLLPDDY